MRMTSFSWKGEEIEGKMKRATGRAAVAIGENVVAEAKQIVHVVTGHLRRSIHVAPRGYVGDGDSEAAEAIDLPNTGEATFVDDAALVEVGSWLDYACVEETGRHHQFITPAVEIVRPRINDIMQQAMDEEGF